MVLKEKLIKIKIQLKRLRIMYIVNRLFFNLFFCKAKQHSSQGMETDKKNLFT